MSSLQDMQNSAIEASTKSADAAALPASQPQRRVERNKSGPQGNSVSRRPPQRSKSHKIGRPAFNKDLPPEPVRGVNRNRSGRLRSAPNRTRSFGKSAPERTGSASSLRAYRKQQQMAGTPGGSELVDDISVSDSVFTSASNQTLDSIMLRKKQFGPGDVKPGGMRMPSRSTDVSTASFEFDESLHTVDSINVHHRHVGEYSDDQGDLSVFSESFGSTDTYALSDYDGEGEGPSVREEDFEEEEFSEDATEKEEDNNDEAMKE